MDIIKIIAWNQKHANYILYNYNKKTYVLSFNERYFYHYKMRF